MNLVGQWAAVGAIARRHHAGGAPAPGPAPGPAPAPAYDVGARLAAFNARLIAVRVAAGQSAVSSFAGLELPTAPTINPGAGGTVTTAGQLADAINTPNAEFVIDGVITATMALGAAAHQRWRFAAGSQLIAPAESYAISWNTAHHQELIGEGGTITGGLNGFHPTLGGSHIKLKGLDIRTRLDSAATYFDAIGIERNHHVLIEGCYQFARAGSGHHYGNTHFIIANSETRCPATDAAGSIEATYRFGEGDLCLVMDSLGFNGVKHTIRGHTGNGRMAYWHNMLIGGGGLFDIPGGGVDLQNADLVVMDNTFHHTATNLCSVPYQSRFPSIGDPQTTRNTMATLAHNTAYSDVETASDQIFFYPDNPALFGWGPGPGWIVTDNPRSAYQAPPAWARQ